MHQCNDTALYYYCELSSVLAKNSDAITGLYAGKVEFEIGPFSNAKRKIQPIFQIHTLFIFPIHHLVSPLQNQMPGMN